MNTLKELEDAGIKPGDILDLDGELVDIISEDFAKVAAVADELGFEDFCVVFSEYCRVRAALEDDDAPKKSWLESSLAIQNAIYV